jgi:trehalose 6-phosphate phosphatase
MSIPDLLDELPEVAARIKQSGAILLGLDLDGTLAPVRPRPEEVVVEEPVRQLLGRLSGLDRLTLTIVSGRSLEDLRARVKLPGLIYAGNHGLEIRGPGMSLVEPTAAALADRLANMTVDLEQQLAGIAGAVVEAKGLTTSVHYRNVAPLECDRLARIVRDAVATDADRFVLSWGHRVWEILPRVAWHKGDAMDWIIGHLGEPERLLVFYLGDDRTDEDAFGRLRSAVTVKIGDRSATTRAGYWLADPPAVERFLNWLARELQAG